MLRARDGGVGVGRGLDGGVAPRGRLGGERELLSELHLDSDESRF